MSRSHAVLLTVLAVFPFFCVAAEVEGPRDLDAALVQAQQRHAAVVVDFHAPWCYSCYYMARNVLTGPEWDAVRQRAVILGQDADSPQGAALKARLGVKALPSYVVLDAQGHELGRILGEQTRADFYSAMDAFLDRGSSLDTLAQRVKGADPDSIAATVEILRSYHARFDAGGGLHWFAGRPESVRSAVAADRHGAGWLARLRFLEASMQHEPAACLAHGERVLASPDLGCARSYELDRYLSCAADAGERARLARQQQARIVELVEHGVFGTQRCADQRSAVLVAADVHAALGEADAEIALLERAIAQVEADSGGDLDKDRNLSDNLRVYRERLAHRTGDHAPYDALMAKLIAAWPDDYVYAFRLGRSLLERGKAAEALPHLEQAARSAYGLNRLQVAEKRVQALQAQDRDADARRVVAEALKANGPWFPEQAAALKKMVAGPAR